MFLNAIIKDYVLNLLFADVEGSESIIPEQIAAVSPEFQKKMDEWERTRSIKCKSVSFQLSFSFLLKENMLKKISNAFFNNFE